MARFLRHEPCPTCGSRDNLGVYSDGSKYCFGCRTSKNGKRNIRKHIQDDTLDTQPVFVHSTRNLPINFTEYYSERYGLTQEEINQYFRYDPATDRSIFQVKENDEIIYQEARSITKIPKAISRGKKPFVTIGNNPELLVIVEDIVSAIKVGRYCTTLPLFGSSITKAFYPLLAQWQTIVIWLDHDKYKEALAFSRVLSQYTKNVLVFSTKLDPKDIPQEELHKRINTVYESIHLNDGVQCTTAGNN
jgi:hypothetical protein